MIIIALSICGALEAIALLHVYWAFGGLWPATSERQLIAMAIGTRQSKMPGRVLTLVVATGISGAGLIAIWAAGLVSFPFADWLRVAALITASVVFLGRGAITYLPTKIFDQTVEPFTTLNKRYYSPLCLIFGAGFLTLLNQI